MKDTRWCRRDGAKETKWCEEDEMVRRRRNGAKETKCIWQTRRHGGMGWKRYIGLGGGH